MDNVIAFAPRTRAPLPPVLPPLAGTGLRAHLEEAAQTALDAADKIIAALDRIEGEDDASLTAMAAHAGQVVHLRETPALVEAEPAPAPMPEPVLQEAPMADLDASEAVPDENGFPEPIHEPIRLPWRGAGNVVSAAGCAVLALVAGRR